MFLTEVIKGCIAEVSAVQGLTNKLQKAVYLVLRVIYELSQISFLIPDVVYIKKLQQNLKNNHSWKGQFKSNIQIHADVQYGNYELNLMDIYIPDKLNFQQGDKLPVVIFVHGGVWAGGDKWESAGMGARMAEDGILTCVINYSLYPQKFLNNNNSSSLKNGNKKSCKVFVDDMVDDVVLAYEYLQENIEKYGGDKKKIFFIGHSAGAQIAFIALIEIIKKYTQILKKQEKSISKQNSTNPLKNLSLNGKQSSDWEMENLSFQNQFNISDFDNNNGTDSENNSLDNFGTFNKDFDSGTNGTNNGINKVFKDANSDTNGESNGISENFNDVMDVQQRYFVPLMFVGLAGVYDIFKHYAFEEMRGANFISTMARAMNGFQNFARNSPICIFQNHLARQENENSNFQNNLNFFEQTTNQKFEYNLQEPVDPRCFYYENFSFGGEAVQKRLYDVNKQLYFDSDKNKIFLTQDMIQNFPQTVFFHGCEDGTVPFHESVELHNLLKKSGIQSELMLYPKGSHVEYAIKWRRKNHIGTAQECAELVQVVKSKTKQKAVLRQKQLNKNLGGVFKKT